MCVNRRTPENIVNISTVTMQLCRQFSNSKFSWKSIINILDHLTNMDS